MFDIFMTAKQNHNLPFDEDSGCFPPMTDEEFAAKVEATNSPVAKAIEDLKRENERLREVAQRLREHIESPACMVLGFDVPDEIWLPFTATLDLSNVASEGHLPAGQAHNQPQGPRG
jgi:hypothetical protein